MDLKKRYRVDNEKDLEEVLQLIQSGEFDGDNDSELEGASELEVVLVPPDDGADTDKDDAGSDAEGESPSISDLGRGVLGTKNAEVRVIKSVSKRIDERTILWSRPVADSSSKSKQPPMKRSKPNRHWIEVDLNVDERFEKQSSPIPDIVKVIFDSRMAPVDLFRELFSYDIIDKMCRETVKYAAQKGFYISLSHEDMYKYIAILLLSGYCKVMHRRQYWETRPDTNNAAIVNSMSRNHFDKIHRFFHINDNSEYSKHQDDKLFKVRPLVNHMNAKFQQFGEPLGNKFSLDEAMEPYYGRHSMKQFIKGKPIRYGFKMWGLAKHNGYLLKFIPYTGKGYKEKGKTLGASITESLCEGYLNNGSTVFLDNYFCTIPLLESLREAGIGCVGVLRRDRIEKAPLPELKKQPKGSTAALKDNHNKISLIGWNDNNEVIIATNLETRGVFGLGSCKRWNSSQSRKTLCSQPTIVQEYNKFMGGIDLFDNLRGLYRIRIRSRKWYWPLIRFCFNGGIVNLWLLYRNYQEMPLLEFRRRIVLALLVSPNIEKPRGVKPKYSSHVPVESRFDKIDHLVDAITTQRRCAKCGKCAKFICVKCNVGLHPKLCFVQYHTQ